MTSKIPYKKLQLEVERLMVDKELNFNVAAKLLYKNLPSVQIVSEENFVRGMYRNKGAVLTIEPTIDTSVLKNLKVRVKSKSKSNEYETKPLILSAWNASGYMMDIDEYCTYYKLPRKDISSYKLVSHTGTPFYNIVFHTKEEFKEDLTEQFINDAIAKLILHKKLPKFKNRTNDKCLRVIYSDVHVAMETNANGFSLYGGVWNEHELELRRLEIINEVKEQIYLHGYFDEIHLIDLGDFMDGWDGLTVRQGHDLPQNMDNQKAFDVGLQFKINIARDIIDLNATAMVRVFNICNDNHSGAFGYVVNSAAKTVLEALYTDRVEVINYRRFINHYTYGNHCFILCHGKDATALKFGFKPHLDNKGEDKIQEYLKVHELHKQYYYVTFEKGDSHQQLLDMCTNDDYDYFNYMALSPSSEWVQTNFKRGKSGFNLMIVEKNTAQKYVIPVLFKWQESKASA